jgi:hypothetical protein
MTNLASVHMIEASFADAGDAAQYTPYRAAVSGRPRIRAAAWGLKPLRSRYYTQYDTE